MFSPPGDEDFGLHGKPAVQTVKDRWAQETVLKTEPSVDGEPKRFYIFGVFPEGM
jgi:hypothetical protein